MSEVVSLMDFKEKRASRRLRTEAQVQSDVNHTRDGLLRYLAPRRERLGMTEQDVRESPERVLEKKNNELHKKQQALLDDYLQSQDSIDTM